VADVGIYTKNADIQALAGVNAGTTAKATAATDVYVLNVEATIDTDSLYDWSSAITAGGIVDAALQKVLTMTSAAKCAMIVVNADQTGYSARERETTLDFLNSLYEAGMKILREKDKSAFIRNEV